jgi:hypothetical protein
MSFAMSLEGGAFYYGRNITGNRPLTGSELPQPRCPAEEKDGKIGR